MNLNYTKPQQQVFFPVKPVRFVVVTKGRRVGLTRGAAQAYIEYCISNNNLRLLWGETIYSNVQRYVDLYFLPILKQLPASSWQWHPKLMQLRIMESVIDFRSADSPETWEGFGYHRIFLNEAGIILRNPELLTKTVLPMLMDYEDSILIAAGVPKGKKLKSGKPHPFYELWTKAESDSSYIRFKFPTHANPFLNRADIKAIEDVLDDQMKLQEIYGEFIDITDNPYLYAFDSGTHVMDKEYIPDERLPLWFSFDFNVDPNSCIVGQQPDYKSGVIFDEVSVKGATEGTCNVLKSKYSHWINKGLVFVTGDATGKSRTAVSGEITNYIVIKKALNLRDYNFKVRTFNMLLKSSQVLCNAILQKGNVRMTDKCIQTAADCQLATVDGGGELVKDSGMHKLDCFRYMLDAWFPDFLDKEHKYK